MGSSGIGVFLPERGALPWHALGFGVLLLLAAGPLDRLCAQAPSHTSAAASNLPRFTLREIISGRNDSLFRIPGSWMGAATVAPPESLAMLAYARVAARSGVTPLDGSTLGSQRSQHVMGLYHRAELVAAARSTLQSIRAALPSDSIRARFDLIFRSRGAWITDLHDAALVWAQSYRPGVNWESARPALAQAGWLHEGDSSEVAESVPRALYGLRVLAASDSTAFAAARRDLLRGDPRSAEAVTLLLNGYAFAQSWYTEAVGFFLSEQWIAEAGARRSVGDLIRNDWQTVRPRDSQLRTLDPEIRTRMFGYPQAVPHYSIPGALFDRLVHADNLEARVWLEQQGQEALLKSLRRLPMGDTTLLLLQVGNEAVRLSTVPRQIEENLNGFLEPHDVISIDPGYSPLLALGAVVHEWQHLVFRRLQLAQFAARLSRPPTAVSLPGVHPYVAEGFAEWSAERILSPVIARWPLLGLGELEKRAGQARENAWDEHPLGYALVQQLAVVLKDPARTTQLLLQHAEDPSRIVAEPALRDAWRRFRGSADYVFAAPARRVLIPEVTFTLEDGFPDVITTRILVPAGKRPTH